MDIDSVLKTWLVGVVTAHATSNINTKQIALGFLKFT